MEEGIQHTNKGKVSTPLTRVFSGPDGLFRVEVPCLDLPLEVSVTKVVRGHDGESMKNIKTVVVYFL